MYLKCMHGEEYDGSFPTGAFYKVLESAMSARGYWKKDDPGQFFEEEMSSKAAAGRIVRMVFEHNNNTFTVMENVCKVFFEFLEWC